MIITKELKNKIVGEVELLENIGDCIGIGIGNNKGLFVEVIDYGEGKEYLIELNDIIEDNIFEPCKEYNAFSKFGNMNKLIETIKNYLE